MSIKVRGDGSKFFITGGGRGHSLMCGRLPFTIADIRATRATCNLLKGLIALYIQISERCKFAGVY